MSQWDFGTSESGFPQSEFPRSGFPPSGFPGNDFAAARFSGDGFDDGFDEGFSPISYERDPYEPDTEPDLHEPEDTKEWAVPFGEFWPDRPPVPGRSGRSSLPRWLVPAVVVMVAVSAGAGVVLLTGGGHAAAPGTPGASGAPRGPEPTAGQATALTPPAAGATRPPLTPAQAQQVVAAYTTANNAANAQRSDALLAGIETGSSYAIDAGIYRVQLAEGAAPYPAFGPQQAQYYIPRQETAYPHWFAVQVANAGLASPRTVTGTEYLVFTQAAPGAPWLNTIEPYVVPGSVPPQVAVGLDGLATPVSADAASLAVSPAQLPQLTAAALDGGQAGGAVPANPGNLADGLDQAFWHKEVPAASVTDQHAPAGGPLLGLLTTDGGALFFYTDAAELTLTAPAGKVLHLTIPGFYSGQALTTAGLGYLDQFATYVPPRGGSGLRVVADYSGITAAN